MDNNSYLYIDETRGADGGCASANEMYRDYAREMREDGKSPLPFYEWVDGQSDVNC